MTTYELVALMASHILVGGIAWELCRRRSAQKIGEGQVKRQLIEAQCARTLAQLREVREQFRVFEHALIHTKLLLEQAQERVVQRQRR